jgi:phage terminase large subunit
MQINAQFTPEYAGLFRPMRYKVRYGGRGGLKSWSFARALLILATEKRLRILCARELQTSIKDSVHRLLVDMIDLLQLSQWFDVTKTSITHRLTGTEFIFKGLRHNFNEIKSTEAIDICWVEEAQLVSSSSWEVLIPTIRKTGSEIWVSFNPLEETDDTYQRFVVNTPPDTDILKVNWDRNPWFPPTLEKERVYMLSIDPEAYEHVWEGNTRKIGSSVIFKNRYVIETWTTPDPSSLNNLTITSSPLFRHGLDFGFANDPMALTRSYTTGEPPDEDLWIDREIFGFNIEIDDYESFINEGDPNANPGESSAHGIHTAKTWPIHADSSRPESISYLAKRGFNITPSEKWPGSVEDGIAHLKAFRQIHIHASCKHMQEEARLYSYKVDRVTGEVLPIIQDRHNHGWDSVRYAHDLFIMQRGELAQWERLSQ